jgi:uncharacterized protein YcfJ
VEKPVFEKLLVAAVGGLLGTWIGGCELEESVLVKQQLVGDFWGPAVEESVLVGRPMCQHFQRIRYCNTLS